MHPQIGLKMYPLSVPPCFFTRETRETRERRILMRVCVLPSCEKRTFSNSGNSGKLGRIGSYWALLEKTNPKRGGSRAPVNSRGIVPPAAPKKREILQMLRPKRAFLMWWHVLCLGAIRATWIKSPARSDPAKPKHRITQTRG